MLSLIVVGMTLVLIWCFIMSIVCHKNIEDWLKECRSLQAPSCSTCKHCKFNHTYRYTEFECACPDACKYKENIEHRLVTACDTGDIRGTKYCRYEKKEEVQEQKED